MAHKFKPETTNGGHCFSDCSCGWRGGVYPNRLDARAAWQAHADGATPSPPVKPIVQLGELIQGKGGAS